MEKFSERSLTLEIIAKKEGKRKERQPFGYRSSKELFC